MIVSLDRLADPAPALAALTAIFFEASLRQDFADEDERQRFLQVWTGWYLNEARRDVLFWRDEADGPFLGYLTGCRDSLGALGLAKVIPRYQIFADQFAGFPAHLHVNVRADARGRGIGGRLIEAFAQRCAADRLPGLHVVTGVQARNVAFYARAGFTFQLARGPSLFLGRAL